MSSYRKTQSAFVCTPTTYLEDLVALEDLVKRYRQLGGKVPNQIEAALQAARAGRNVEESLNLACDGLFKFYLAEETRCAKAAGFSGVQDMYQRGGTEWEKVAEIYDPCIAQVVHKWPLTNIDYTINLNNPDSAISQFLLKTKEQVFRLTSKWVKKKLLQNVKGKAPPYERAPTP